VVIIDAILLRSATAFGFYSYVRTTAAFRVTITSLALRAFENDLLVPFSGPNKSKVTIVLRLISATPRCNVLFFLTYNTEIATTLTSYTSHRGRKPRAMAALLFDLVPAFLAIPAMPTADVAVNVLHALWSFFKVLGLWLLVAIIIFLGSYLACRLLYVAINVAVEVVRGLHFVATCAFTRYRSQRGTLPFEQVLNDIVDDIVRQVGQHICMDSTRKAFVRDAASTLVHLVHGHLKGRDGYRRVLLGRKGVGKTYLLRTLHAVATKRFRKDGLLCVWVDYEDKINARRPLHAAVRQLGWIPGLASSILVTRKSTSEYVHFVENALQWMGVRLFVVVDEVQNAFMTDCRRGREIINEFEVVGASKNGVTHWVLCGSSHYLRGLITGQHNIKHMHEIGFTHYGRDNLNGRKFVPIPIFPFLDTDDFRSLVAHHRRVGSLKELDNDELGKLYLKTCGIAGDVAALAINPEAAANAWAKSSKGLGHPSAQDNESHVLRTVAQLTDATVSIMLDADDALKTYSRWTTPVSLTDLRSHLITRKLCEACDVEPICYRLSDRGLLRYFENDNPTVSLGSPVIIQNMWTDATALNIDEIAALRTGNRNNDKDVAGNTSLRLIAFAARQESAIVTFGFKIGEAPDAITGVQTLRLGTDANLSIDAVLNKMWKETLAQLSKPERDALGADGVVVTVGESMTVAHRIQVKIKKGRLESKEAKDIIQRFACNEKATMDAYKAAGISLNCQRWILASTQDVDPEVRKQLSNAKVDLWDKSFLAKNVWPPHVKLIDKRFQG